MVNKISNQKLLEVKNQLDDYYERVITGDFIEDDPIGIPHRFSKREDQEIAGFFAAIFAWGQRVTILNKTNDLLNRMDHDPYQFILNHSESDLKSMKGFVHRTFNETDLLFMIHRLKRFLLDYGSIEKTFSNFLSSDSNTIEPALIGFYEAFFDDEFAPKRTRKHIASPSKKSTCKRLCMYMRWMVRKDEIDLGIWNSITPNQLMIPLDVHVERLARKLNLLTRKQRDWKSVIELTSNLRQMDSLDPVKYDLSLFGGSVLNFLIEND